jgi:predicted unusual protein kinase regulating ubiquinone biosynthesis (AarF/ABC1/UbiB family)
VTDYVVAFVSGDYRKLGETMVAMGGVSNEVNLDQLADDLRETYQSMLSKSFAEIKYDDLLPRIQKVASRHRMRLPKEFVLITKQMLYFDRYAKLLAPNLNVFNDPRLVFSLMTDIQRARQLREETIARMRAQDLTQAQAS